MSEWQPVSGDAFKDLLLMSVDRGVPGLIRELAGIVVSAEIHGLVAVLNAEHADQRDRDRYGDPED